MSENELNELVDKLIMDITGCDEYEVRIRPLWIHELAEKIILEGWRK